MLPKLRLVDARKKDEIEVPKDRLLYKKGQARWDVDVLAIRAGGKFCGSGYWLSSEYDWVLGLDENNETVLIPLKKEGKK